jgi:thymidylate kinase
MKIICFEGSDGLGKTTQTRELILSIRKKGYSVKYFKLPTTDTFIGKSISKMLKSGFAKRNPNIFQLINSLDKFIFQITKLTFNKKVDYIILDRWHLSSVVYGISGGANKTIVNSFWKILKEPDITFVFDGENFLNKREDLDSYEKDNSFQKEVLKNYQLYSKQIKNCHIINANDSIFNISQKISNITFE